MNGIENQIVNDELKRYREKFEEVVNDLLKNEFQNIFVQKFDGSIKPSYSPKNTQYSGVIYWYNLKLNENIRKCLKPEYSNIWGIHLMPYCITEDDVLEAEIKKNGFKEDSANIDYDDRSGNFHKFPVDVANSRYQVVLIPFRPEISNPEEKPKKLGGPGFKINSLANVKNEDRLTYIKTDWYFPHIQKNIEKIDLNDNDNLNRMKELLFGDLHAALKKILVEK